MTESARAFSSQEISAMKRAVLKLGREHMGTQVHSEPYAADWREPGLCDACARLLLVEMLHEAGEMHHA